MKSKFHDLHCTGFTTTKISIPKAFPFAEINKKRYECANCFLTLFLQKISQSTKRVKCHNHFHNILRLFDVLPNLALTTSETMRDYYV